MRWTVAVLVGLMLCACGAAGNDGREAEMSVGAAGGLRGCDTAFIFDPVQDPDVVLDAMQVGKLRPVEVRFSTPGGANGSTGGGIGAPGEIGTVESVSKGLRALEELYNVEPMIIGIRVSGTETTDGFGDLADAIHTQALVPTGSAVALSSPEVDAETVQVRGGNSAGC